MKVKKKKEMVTKIGLYFVCGKGSCNSLDLRFLCIWHHDFCNFFKHFIVIRNENIYLRGLWLYYLL